MSVKLEAVQVGSVFEFPAGPRRVVKLGSPIGGDFNRGFNVCWEYADGQKRAGRLEGELWIHYFRRQAVREIPDQWREEAPSVELLGSGRVVPACREPVSIELHTRAPAKWAFVDQETGEIWTHDGSNFRRMSPDEIRELDALVSTKARLAREEQMELTLP